MKTEIEWIFLYGTTQNGKKVEAWVGLTPNLKRGAPYRYPSYLDSITLSYGNRTTKILNPKAPIAIKGD